MASGGIGTVRSTDEGVDVVATRIGETDRKTGRWVVGEKLRGCLNARNESIYARGFKAVGETTSVSRSVKADVTPWRAPSSMTVKSSSTTGRNRGCSSMR